MSAPKNLEEALGRAPTLTSKSIAFRLANSGTDKLASVYQLAVKEYQSLRALAVQDLGSGKLMDMPKTTSWEDRSVEAISNMISSSGLQQLSLLRKALSGLSGQNENVNTWRTWQLLAWLSSGKERKSVQNRALILFSQVEQIPSAIERSLRTPVNKWGEEIGVLFSTGGGMSTIVEMFAGTPIEGILGVTISSLENYLQLQSLADAQERLKVDMQLQAALYNRKTSVAARIGQSDLAAYERAETTYHNYKSRLEAMKGRPGTEMSAEYMRDLQRLTTANARALAQYQKCEAKVQHNPSVIDEARVNLLQCLNLAEAYAQTEYRLRKMAIEFRRNGLLRVNQMVMMICAMSAVFCDQVMAENRANQEKILESCDSILKSISQQSQPEVIEATATEIEPVEIEQ